MIVFDFIQGLTYKKLQSVRVKWLHLKWVLKNLSDLGIFGIQNYNKPYQYNPTNIIKVNVYTGVKMFGQGLR